MKKILSSNSNQSIFVRLWPNVKTYRQQFGIIVVAVTLGLMIVLNVAMAPKTLAQNTQAQMSYLKEDAVKSSSITK